MASVSYRLGQGLCTSSLQLVALVERLQPVSKVWKVDALKHRERSLGHDAWHHGVTERCRIGVDSQGKTFMIYYIA